MTKHLTLQEHWDLHQGLWKMLGCDMEIKYQDNNNIVYFFSCQHK